MLARHLFEMVLNSELFGFPNSDFGLKSLPKNFLLERQIKPFLMLIESHQNP